MRPNRLGEPPKKARAIIRAYEAAWDLHGPPAAQDEGLPTHAAIDLRERVQRALLAEDAPSYTAQHARVEVDHHHVTLYGEARTSREKREPSQIVRGVDGVRRVDTRVVVINRTPHAIHMHAAPR